MSRLRIAAVAAIVVVMGLGATAIAVHDTSSRGGAAAARAFLTAQRRSLLGTWKVEQRFTRLVNSRPGQPLVETVLDAQRPPDHLIVSPGSVDSVFHNRRMACGTGPDGQVHCRDAGVATPYADQVNATIANLMTYVLGTNPPYRVSDDGKGCYVLQLRESRTTSNVFGTRSELCFDRATGAPVRTEVNRPEGQDVTVAVNVSGKVTDDDLRPPA